MQLSYIYAVENESAVWHLAQHRNIKKHFSHVCQCLVNYIETLNIRRVPIFEIESACPHRKPFGFNWIRLCVKNNGTIWIPTLAWERKRERSSAVGVLSDASQNYEHESERKTRVEEDVFQRWGRFWFWNEDDERRKREQHYYYYY